MAAKNSQKGAAHHTALPQQVRSRHSAVQRGTAQRSTAKPSGRLCVSPLRSSRFVIAASHLYARVFPQPLVCHVCFRSSAGSRYAAIPVASTLRPSLSLLPPLLQDAGPAHGRPAAYALVYMLYVAVCLGDKVFQPSAHEYQHAALPRAWMGTSRSLSLFNILATPSPTPPPPPTLLQYFDDTLQAHIAQLKSQPPSSGDFLLFHVHIPHPKKCTEYTPLPYGPPCSTLMTPCRPTLRSSRARGGTTRAS